MGLPKDWDAQRDRVGVAAREVESTLTTMKAAGFPDLTARVEKLLSQLKPYLGDPLVVAPKPALEALAASLDHLRGAMTAWIANPADGRISGQAWGALANAEERFATVLGSVVLRGDRFDQFEATLRQAKAEQAHLTKMREQLDAAFPHAMVQAQQKHFADEMQKHVDAADSWLFAAAGALVVLVIAAVAAPFVLLPPTARAASGAVVPPSTAEVISFLGSKAVALSALYFLLVVCVKNYRAHRHLAVSYEQRKNAIGTFEAFVDAAKDTKNSDETRKAILLATTSAIFTPIATGYSTDQPDPTPLQALELVKSIKS